MKDIVTEHVYDALNRRVRTVYPAAEVWTGSGYETVATQMHPKTGEIVCLESEPERDILRGQQVLFLSAEGPDSSPLAIRS